MDRTIVVQLKPTPEQARILKQTLDVHTACFNEVAHLGFTTRNRNGVDLHKQTYYELRRKFPDLPSQLVIAARVKATEAVKSALTWQKKHEASYPKKVAKAKKLGKEPPVFKPVKSPHAKFCPVRYDARSYWVKWQTSTASLATIAGRIELPFTVPAYAQQYTGYPPTSANLCYRKGKWTLHITVSLPAPMVAPTQGVIGVDLGLNRPAVTSARQFLGEKHWKEQERRIFRLRRMLQKKGTKSAKKHLKKLSGKRFRQRRDCLFTHGCADFQYLCFLKRLERHGLGKQKRQERRTQGRTGRNSCSAEVFLRNHASSSFSLAHQSKHYYPCLHV
jgi:putative transposase